MTEDQQVCPTCKGSGKVAVTQFKVGDRVLWNTGGWWGKKPSVVIALSREQKRVRIKTDPHLDHNGGRPYYAYVTPKKLELQP